MKSTTSPIFIFSLPRSGSTLLQRILMGHPKIASVSEPWLLLPFLYANKKHGTLAEYSHSLACRGIGDFVNNLHRQEKDYYKELNSFIGNLYKMQCRNEENYFLDKTPRYYFIIPEIVKLFPNAKFIFLFRNPIHVLSSIMETWSNGNFGSLHHFDCDLNKGPGMLSEGYKLLKNKSYALQYEEFVSAPEKHLIKICKYLEIDYDNQMLNNFNFQETKGSMGDPTGLRKFNIISTKSLTNWKKSFTTRFRIKHVKKYINSISEEHLILQGYKKNELINSLNQLPSSINIPIKDFFDIIKWRYTIKFNLNIIAGRRTSKWVKEKMLS